MMQINMQEKSCRENAQFIAKWVVTFSLLPSARKTDGSSLTHICRYDPFTCTLQDPL